jgi:hypothetical protein
VKGRYKKYKCKADKKERIYRNTAAMYQKRNLKKVKKQLL